MVRASISDESNRFIRYGSDCRCSLIIKYWAPIKAFIGGVVAGFSAAIEPIKALFTPLQPIFDGVGNAIKWVSNLFGDLFTPVKTTSAELNNAAEMGRKFGEWLANGVNIALTPLKALIDGIKWVLDNLPKIDMGEGAKNHALSIASNPALASGVLTGNYGPVISTNNYKPYTMPKPTVNSSVVHAPITIVQQPGQDDKKMAEMVKKHIADTQRQAAKQARGNLS